MTEERWLELLERYEIPQHMREGVIRAYVHGLPPGGFLQAVIDDSLMLAFANADEVNRAAMYNWANLMFMLQANGIKPPKELTQ